jgi:hypothetical protein
MSLLLVLGSPLLGAYSLTLMMFNAHWINAQFRKLEQQSNNAVLCPRRPNHCSAINDVRYSLIEMMHVPIKVLRGEDYDLAQALVRPENVAMWESLATEIAKTKRAMTLSLYAQLA